MDYFQSKFDKKEVGKMFNNIAPMYDFLNRFFSLGIDLYWRKKLAKAIERKSHFDYLDIACGTGDQIIAVYKEHRTSLRKVVGVDIAIEMLALAKKKLPKHVQLIEENALQLPFKDNSFDVISISFGIRNMPDLSLCLKEMRRVLKPDGKLCILEFSIPQNRLVKTLHLFYLRKILPGLGAVVSNDSTAYRYLNETIEEFPYGESFCSILKKNGFNKPECKPLTFGIASLYVS